MLLALAPDEVGLRVIDARPRELSTRDLQLERDQVLALKEIVQQRGRKRSSVDV